MEVGGQKKGSFLWLNLNHSLLQATFSTSDSPDGTEHELIWSYYGMLLTAKVILACGIFLITESFDNSKKKSSPVVGKKEEKKPFDSSICLLTCLVPNPQACCMNKYCSQYHTTIGKHTRTYWFLLDEIIKKQTTKTTKKLFRSWERFNHLPLGQFKPYSMSQWKYSGR